MTDTTPLYGIPFPELSDAPNVPADMESLATEVETEIARVDADLLSRGRGVKAVITSTGNGTPVVAETLQLSTSFTAEANRTYRVTASGGTVDGAAVAVCAGVVNIRWAQAGTVTTAGTGIARTQVPVPASGSSNEEGAIPGFHGYLQPAAGTVTVGVFISSSTANTVALFSTSVAGLRITVEDVGPSSLVVTTTAALP